MMNIKNIIAILLIPVLSSCNTLSSNTEFLDGQSPSSPFASSQKSIFQLEEFPKDACGDSLPTKNDSSISLYPVFVSYSESNLQKIKNSFCKDAFTKDRKDTGEKTIQVASFISQEKAEQFSEFMREHLGSGEVGTPIRLIASIEGFPKDACGDPVTADTQPTNLYPVFVDYSESNLLTIQLNFCRDAFPTIQEEIGKQSIQVASFTTEERAESFKKLMQEHLGSGEIGKPSRLENEPIIESNMDNIRKLKYVGIKTVLPSYLPNNFHMVTFQTKIGELLPNQKECNERGATVDSDGNFRDGSEYTAEYKGPNSASIRIWATDGGYGDGSEEIRRWAINTQPFGKITLEEMITPNSDKYLSAGALIKKSPCGRTVYFFDFDSPSGFVPEEAIKILESLQVLRP